MLFVNPEDSFHASGPHYNGNCFTCQDLKEEFERDAQTTNRPRLLLTAAVAAGKATIDAAYDIPTMNL